MACPEKGAGSRETSMRPVLPSMKSVDRLSCFQVHDLRIDVFRADAEANNAGGDPPESWKSRRAGVRVSPRIPPVAAA